MDWKAALPHIQFDPQKSLNDLLALWPLDFSQLPALQEACWPEIPLLDVHSLITHILTRHQRGCAWGMVAAVKDQIVGFGQVARLNSLRCEISDLVVSAAWRGQGIGTALVTALVDTARRQGFAIIEIGAAESNKVALSLYRRLGFEEYKQVLLDVGQGLERIIYLRLQLDSIQRGE